MSVKDLKGREILITIKQESTDERKRRRGMVPPVDPPDDFLPRRKQGPPPPTGICVDVYDMAADSGGVDRGFRQDATISGWFSETNFTFGNTNYTAAYNSFFAGGPFSPSSYLRVTADNIAKFGNSGSLFALMDFDATRGFRHGGGDLVVPNGAAWQYFRSGSGDAGSPTYTKITNGLYTDAAVPFTIDRDAELYLPPRIFFNYGNATKAIWGLGTGSPPTSRESYLANYCFEALPRSYFLDNAAWESYKSAKLLATCHNNWYGRGSDTFATPFGTGIILPRTEDTPATLKTSWTNLNQTKAGARLEKNVFTSGGNTQSTIAATSFPPYVAGVAFNNSGPLPFYGYSDDLAQTYNVDPGLFLGAIKLKASGSTPEQWFYFYRKVSTVLWSVSCNGGTAPGGGASPQGRYTVRV